MGEQRFTTSPTPHITVETCGGDLSITGLAGSEVAFSFDEGDGRVEREGETFRLTIGGDCAITCPPASSLTVQTVGGDFRAADLSGTLAIAMANADVSVRGAGVVTLQTANSDVSARDIAGDLRIELARNDLEARSIGGQLIVANVAGDLSARSLKGGAEISRVSGDVSIDTDFSPGKTYRVRAGGDLTLRLAPDASLRMSARAGGKIENRVEFTEWSGDSRSGQGLIGSGEAQVELSAGGDLILLPVRSDADFSFDFDAFGSQIEAKMGQFERDLETRLSELGEHIARMAALGTADLEARLRRLNVEGVGRRAEHAAERARYQAERAAERARQQAERAAERMREKAERARRHAERAAERTRRRAERRGHSHGFDVHVDLPPPWGPPRPGRPTPPPPPPPRAARPTATEEERLMILRMLQEHKISADEASRLLDALEG